MSVPAEVDVPADWRTRAACRGRPVWLWFAGDARTTAVARRLCVRCPVRPDCAAEALRLLDTTESLVGTWAGVSLGSVRTAATRAELIEIAGCRYSSAALDGSW